MCKSEIIKCRQCGDSIPYKDLNFKSVLQISTGEIHNTLNSRKCKKCRKRSAAIRNRLKKIYSYPLKEICDCCETDVSNRFRSNGARNLVLDHDDNYTGKYDEFRGWICESCNTGIGKLSDNRDGLIQATNYLDTVTDRQKKYKNVKTKIVNIKPKTQTNMKNQDTLPLIQFLLAHNDLESAMKVITLQAVESTLNTVKTYNKNRGFSSKGKSANEKRKLKFEYIDSSLNDYDPNIKTIKLSEYFNLANPSSIYNRCDDKIIELAESGSLYRNPKGTQEFLVKAGTSFVLN